MLIQNTLKQHRYAAMATPGVLNIQKEYCVLNIRNI